MSHLSKGSSSSNPASTRCRPRRAERPRGIPRFCRCGDEAVIKTSGTAKNPGRLFYCCPQGTEGDKCHLFTWTDERVVEEVEDLKVLASELKQEVSEMRCALEGLHKQLEQDKPLIETSTTGSGCCGIL